VPFLRGIGGAGGRPGGEAVQGAVGLRHRVAATNEPLGRWAITAALDIRRPLDGPFTGGEPGTACNHARKSSLDDVLAVRSAHQQRTVVMHIAHSIHAAYTWLEPCISGARELDPE
jgi:hypothetical protein